MAILTIDLDYFSRGPFFPKFLWEDYGLSRTAADGAAGYAGRASEVRISLMSFNERSSYD
jgi:hypothetical protein